MFDDEPLPSPPYRIENDSLDRWANWFAGSPEADVEIVYDALFRITDGSWVGLISSDADASDRRITHFRLRDSKHEPLALSWRHHPRDLSVVQIIFIGHPDRF